MHLHDTILTLMKHPVFDHPLCTPRLRNVLRNYYWKKFSGDIHDCVREHTPNSITLIQADVLFGDLSPKRVTGYGKKTHAILCKIIGVNPDSKPVPPPHKDRLLISAILGAGLLSKLNYNPQPGEASLFASDALTLADALIKAHNESL